MPTYAARVRREATRIVRDIVINAWFASALVPDRARWRLLRLAGFNVAPSRIAPRVFVGTGSLTIGADSFVNREVLLDPTAGITIGLKVNIGMRCSLITASHKIGPTQSTRTNSDLGSEMLAPINIGDHVWIGAGVTILPGVAIEPGCVIAAGAVVVKNCQANGLYGGVPAARIRDLSA